MHAVMFACPNGHRIPKAWLYQGIGDGSRAFLEHKFRRYHEYRCRIAESGGVPPVPRRVLRFMKRNPDLVVPHAEPFSQENPLADRYPFDDLRHDPDF